MTDDLEMLVLLRQLNERLATSYAKQIAELTKTTARTYTYADVEESFFKGYKQGQFDAQRGLK